MNREWARVDVIIICNVTTLQENIFNGKRKWFNVFNEPSTEDFNLFIEANRKL